MTITNDNYYSVMTKNCDKCAIEYKNQLPTAILVFILQHVNINIECEISAILLLVPLSKLQHSEINLEAKTKVPYHIC